MIRQLSGRNKEGVGEGTRGLGWRCRCRAGSSYKIVTISDIHRCIPNSQLILASMPSKSETRNLKTEHGRYSKSPGGIEGPDSRANLGRPWLSRLSPGREWRSIITHGDRLRPVDQVRNKATVGLGSKLFLEDSSRSFTSFSSY